MSSVLSLSSNPKWMHRQLITNLNKARTICQRVRDKTQYIINNVPSCNKSVQDEIRGLGISVMNSAYEATYGHLIYDKFDEAAIFKIAEIAEQSGIVTCRELSAVGYAYSLHHLNKKAEIFYIVNGNHVFLVLGRDKTSHPQDYTKWGFSTVVCDLWDNKVYPAAELEKHLHSLKRLRSDGTPILSKFDTQKQSLSLLFES